MPDLVLAEVTKRFGKVAALQGFSLEIRHREFMALVGPSGCGKTTALRLIAGLERPDEGHIYIDGELADGWEPVRRGVQMVFEHYALWPHMRVGDDKRSTNLSLPLKVRGWLPGQIRARLEEVASQVSIGRRLFHRRPRELSAGEQQRVALGRALAFPPRILLMDEPLANLEPLTREKVRQELRHLHDTQGLTSIYVTHNMAEALALADKIAVMNEGRILQVAEPRTLWEHPANELVASFVRSATAFPGPGTWR